MKALTNRTMYTELKLEFEDRFGKMPEGFDHLIDLMYLKNLIKSIVQSSKVTKKTLEFTLTEEASANVDVKVLYGRASEIGEVVRMSLKDAKFNIIFDVPTSSGEVIRSAIQLFEGGF